MKKLLSLLALLNISVCIWADAIEINGIYYNLIDKTKMAEVTNKPNYNNYYTGNVTIPETVEHDGKTYSVTSIGDRSFIECIGLTSISIPNSVQSIGEYAFAGCYHLTSVIIGNGVKSIGFRAFRNCKDLTSVTIPNSVTSIGEESFGECGGLTSVTIGNSVKSIGKLAFHQCNGLTSIEIPNSVTTIGEYAFYQCSGLASITIPNSVTSIDQYAFAQCTSLKSMELPNSITKIAGHTFRECKSLTSIVIPDGVTEIAGNAFYCCTGLTSVEIPNSVTIMGWGAFQNCTGLLSVDIPDNLTEIGMYIFSGCTGLTSVTIPKSVKSIGDYSFSGCTGLTSIEIPNNVLYIKDYTFSGCSKLTSVTIGTNVQKIGEYAFANCPEITDVYCYANIIPTTSRTCFSDSYTEYATLHVPAIYISTMMSLSPWNSFMNIVALPTPEGIAINETNFPDENFRNWILGQAYGKDSVLTDEEIEMVTEINIYKEIFHNLDGIKYFKELKTLTFSQSTVPALDVSGMSKLEELQCDWCSLKASGLNVSGCTALKSIVCSDNQLTSLDLTGCTALEELHCEYNQLTSLDVSGCKALKELSCYYNQLTSLNVSGCSALKQLVCYHNRLTSLDLSGCTALIEINCYKNNIQGAEMDAFIKSLPTVSYGMLRIMYKKEIFDEWIEQNMMTPQQVKAAKAKGWTAYIYYQTSWHEMPQEGIVINETSFPDANFRNWVLNHDYGADGVLTDKEIAMVTEMDISNRNIYNLEGISYFTELKTLTCNGCKLSQLNLSNNTKLESLSCVDNKLTELDLSACPLLTKLQCPQNKLTSINLSGCTVLWYLQCYGNQLTAIDLTDCKGLIDIDCGSNQLTAIDVSKCTKLKVIRCVRNQLTAIDVSACKDLISIDCQENQLTSLDCSGLTELQTILCAMNTLTSINISGCSKLNTILCEFNNLGINAFQHIMTNIPEHNESDGAIMFVYSESPGEGIHDYTPDHNICSKEQVAIAKAKGWAVYYVNNTRNDLPYEGVDVTPDIAYRPFIEEDKVWKVGHVMSENESKAQIVSYLYFDGDTIINGQTAKRMLRDRVAAKEWESQNIEREYVGAWYEKDKKVYCMNVDNNDFELAYDFSLNVGETINLYDYMVLGNNGLMGVVTKRATGGMYGFKGNYLDIEASWEDKYWSEEDMKDITVVFKQTNQWLEGIGSEYPPLNPPFVSFKSPFATGEGDDVLMSCSIDDEVIYYNDDYEDGASSEAEEAKKRRFDFNHTIKTQPKSPKRRGEEVALYGEYNDRVLDVKLDRLNELYEVQITNNKTSEVTYSKTINAKNIVALNIDISKYTEGQYEITIDNSNETFSGMIDTTATGIAEIVNGKSSNSKSIYNLQGQRINNLQRGFNIIEGKKIFVK